MGYFKINVETAFSDSLWIGCGFLWFGQAIELWEFNVGGPQALSAVGSFWVVYFPSSVPSLTFAGSSARLVRWESFANMRPCLEVTHARDTRRIV